VREIFRVSVRLLGEDAGQLCGVLGENLPLWGR
jgi:hypothetical protein